MERGECACFEDSSLQKRRRSAAHGPFDDSQQQAVLREHRLLGVLELITAGRTDG
jgi:hypothetical protein